MNRENDNEDVVANQARVIKANSIDIIDRIKGKCDKQHLKEILEIDVYLNTGRVRRRKVLHYVLESGLHVYLWMNNVSIFSEEMKDKNQIIYPTYDGETMCLSFFKISNWVPAWDNNTFIYLRGSGILAGMDISENNIKTHPEYLNSDNINIFSLAKEKIKRSEDEKVIYKRTKLKTFEEMIEKEIGPIGKKVENKKGVIDGR